MSSSGVLDRRRFQEAMGKIAIGAALVRRSRRWVVIKQQRRDTSVELTLKCGRRGFRVNVPICHSGPVLWEVGLRVGAPPPSQCGLFGWDSYAPTVPSESDHG